MAWNKVGSKPETHSRLDQARTLFALFPDLDRVYLEKRIRYESAGDHGLEILS